MARVSVGIDPKINQNVPRNFRFSSFLRKLRLNRKDQYRCRDTATNPPRSTTRVSARPRPKTASVSRTQPRPTSISHRHPDKRRIRHPYLRYAARHLHILLHVDGRIDMDLRLNQWRSLWWNQLVLRKLRRRSLGDRG